MFAQARPTAEIAGRLRVSEKWVREWRRRWAAGGLTALALTGPGGMDCKLDGEQRVQLGRALDAGPLAHGWDDQRWTLAIKRTSDFQPL